MTNKRKIINDPVYGFIDIPFEEVYDVIEHPWFQRLRRIRQLGLTHYVYPAANHNRFQHALGAVHLMSTALDVIERKGCVVSETDRKGVILAILLHDMGHGPFSHALEDVLIPGVSHEQLSMLFMESLNTKFEGILEGAISVFGGEHPRNFLRQLVSSQLDMDRLDYLQRDSFFTGVSEGVVGSERIIKMLRVVNDDLVVDRKGIYSIEKFLISRRLMYWQVYLHKTVLVAEQMLVRTLLRARELAHQGENLFVTPELKEMLYPGRLAANPMVDPVYLLDLFSRIADNDIFTALKVWATHADIILAELAGGLVHRKLLGIRIQKNPFRQELYDLLLHKVMVHYSLNEKEAGYLVFTREVSNSAYQDDDDQIQFWDNSGQLLKLSETSDIVNVPLLSRADKKFFLCAPKIFLSWPEQ